MTYRYAILKADFEGVGNSEDDWQQLLGYAKTSFSHVLDTGKTLYFNATPMQVRSAANILRIGTAGFSILTNSKLEPSTQTYSRRLG